MRLLPDLVYTGGRVQPGLAVDVAEGRIAAVTPAGEAAGALRLRRHGVCILCLRHDSPLCARWSLGRLTIVG